MKKYLLATAVILLFSLFIGAGVHYLVQKNSSSQNVSTVNGLTQCAYVDRIQIAGVPDDSPLLGPGYCFYSPAHQRNICASFESNCLSQHAEESKDIKDCEKIQEANPVDAVLRGACYGTIAGIQKNIGLCEEVSRKNDCYASYAHAAQDSSACEKIVGSDPHVGVLKDACYVQLVIDSKDPALCNKISNLNLKQTCLSKIK